VTVCACTPAYRLVKKEDKKSGFDVKVTYSIQANTVTRKVLKGKLDGLLGWDEI
jgi:hypothetical protein